MNGTATIPKTLVMSVDMCNSGVKQCRVGVGGWRVPLPYSLVKYK